MKTQSNVAPSAARMNQLHAAALTLNVAHNAALAASAADTVAAIGAPPDAPVTPTTPAEPAAPPRAIVGAPVALDASTVHSALTFRGAVLDGTPNPRRRDALTLSALVIAPLALTSDDARDLMRRASTLLRSAGATTDAYGDSPAPADADALAVAYLASRATTTRPVGYFAENRVSDLDRVSYLTRAAERCVYAADRVTSGKTPARNFSGGYNGRLSTEIRRDSVAHVVRAYLAPPAPSITADASGNLHSA